MWAVCAKYGGNKPLRPIFLWVGENWKDIFLLTNEAIGIIIKMFGIKQFCKKL
jgi:hypothetical protein